MRNFTSSLGGLGESLGDRQVIHLRILVIFCTMNCPGITYDISNKHRLGYSEVELVQKMIDGVNTLVKEDRELAKKHGL